MKSLLKIEENNQNRENSKDYAHCGRANKLNIFSLEKIHEALPGSRGSKTSFVLFQEIRPESTFRKYKDLNENVKTGLLNNGKKPLS